MINLFTNYYVDKNPARQHEIDLCLKNNLANPFLNVIILNSQERLKFNFIFNKINLLGSHHDLNIIANSDIYFDETIKHALDMKNNECYALSRWDITSNGPVHYAHHDSQDAWIFKGKIKSNIYGDFYLGFLGCDNRIAYEINKAGYLLTNPSSKIKAYHVHQSEVRNYTHNSQYSVPGPYLRVGIT